MAQRHQKHASAHPYIDTIWTTQNLTDGTYTATPDGAWDLIVCRDEHGKRFAFLAGQETEPQQVPYAAHTSSLVISFAPHVYICSVQAKQLTDTTLMLDSDGPDHFVLDGKRFAFPEVASAEQLVDDLIAQGCIASDQAVEKAETYAASPRTLQRHFADTTGVTQKKLAQVKQAQHAVRLLKNGMSPADAAVEAGYYDQAHMARALRQIMGKTPSDIDEIHKL